MACRQYTPSLHRPFLCLRFQVACRAFSQDFRLLLRFESHTTRQGLSIHVLFSFFYSYLSLLPGLALLMLLFLSFVCEGSLRIKKGTTQQLAAGF